MLYFLIKIIKKIVNRNYFIAVSFNKMKVVKFIRTQCTWHGMAHAHDMALMHMLPPENIMM